MNAVGQPPKLAAPSTIDGGDVAQNLGYSSPVYRLIACGFGIGAGVEPWLA
jgi:hypothetical protein